MQAVPDSIKAYSRIGLHGYDPLIMGLLVRHVWGCRSTHLVDHYRRHVTSNHADIGVGTGYCLNRCEFGAQPPRIALIDLQPNCLDHAARRLAKLRPETYVRDATRPIEGIHGPRFDSVALGGILHCLSGDLNTKAVVFDAVKPLTKAGTKVFGYTLVADGVSTYRRRRVVHDFLNRLRVIDNARDHVRDLSAALLSRFIDCRIELLGCMALFSAVVPERARADDSIAITS